MPLTPRHHGRPPLAALLATIFGCLDRRAVGPPGHAVVRVGRRADLGRQTACLAGYPDHPAGRPLEAVAAGPVLIAVAVPCSPLSRLHCPPPHSASVVPGQLLSPQRAAKGYAYRAVRHCRGGSGRFGPNTRRGGQHPPCISDRTRCQLPVKSLSTKTA